MTQEVNQFKKNTNKQTHEIRKTMKEEIDKRKYKKHQFEI
jgi:hypothetical protein